MSDNDSNWKFANDAVIEDEVIARARQHSLELGVTPIAPAVGAQVAVVVAATGAGKIIELGTGLGVSGLWLLRGAAEAELTSIDTEVDHQQAARQYLADAGHSAAKIRLIGGRALDVLPRMNENAYDIVLVDADPAHVIEYVEHGLRLARPGGTVLVPHALWQGKVGNPASRDDIAIAFRTLISEISQSGAVVSALSTVGDGLLQITKLAA
ncbi:MAG TPA: class I SAM-dependent methyltransferase [Gryllotalpicola sp.]